jgi:hypothetical protein
MRIQTFELAAAGIVPAESFAALESGDVNMIHESGPQQQALGGGQ